MSNCQACEESQQEGGHLGSSPGIVPDIPEECRAQSDDQECLWASEDEIKAELIWARSLKQAEIDRFVERVSRLRRSTCRAQWSSIKLPSGITVYSTSAATPGVRRHRILSLLRFAELMG
jgi:hypothetical protein